MWWFWRFVEGYCILPWLWAKKFREEEHEPRLVTGQDPIRQVDVIILFAQLVARKFPALVVWIPGDLDHDVIDPLYLFPQPQRR
jgi:hypothetical protein